MNFKCRKCGRYVREEEQSHEMKTKKLCPFCLMSESMTPRKSIFSNQQFGGGFNPDRK